MAAFGAASSGAATGAVTQLDTGNINVTGSDLALVCGFAEVEAASSPAITFTWDPAGNNESMTGTYTTLDQGVYLDMEFEYLDNPTAANAPVRASWTGSMDECVVFGLFATAAGDITGTDFDTDGFDYTGSSVSATVPNAAADDLLVDMVCTVGLITQTAGADQTERVSDVDSGSYCRMSVSTQDGADGGVMSWTITDTLYGAGLIAVRIPDVGGGGGDASSSIALLGVG